MPRTSSLAGLSFAALVALAGCSSPVSEVKEASAPATSAEATEEASVPATSATPSAEAETGTYSSAELADILGGISEADGVALQVIPGEQFEQSMDQARQFLESVAATPEQCKIFVANSLEVPEGAGHATGVSSTNGDAVQTIVSASSSADPAYTQQRIDASDAALSSCSSFSLDARGEVIEQTVEAVDAVTEAETTYGSLTTQSTSDGSKQETMTVIGARGDLAVTAIRTAQALPEGTQEDLQDLIDETLAAAGQS